MKNFSIIIPLHNEQENVTELAREITYAFQWVDYDWEVIWVDDCSDDLTVSLLQAHAIQDQRFKVLSLPERLGREIAIMSGLERSQFNMVGTLDGDGQNSPYDLLTLKRLVERDDLYLAQGVRIDRKDSKFRLFSSAVANIFRKVILKDDFNDVGCAVRVFRKDVVQSLPSFNGWHLFFPIITSYIYPEKVIEHPVSHRQRPAGISKYEFINEAISGVINVFEILKLKHRVVPFSKR